MKNARQKNQSLNAVTPVLLVLLSLTSACSRENRVYQDPAANVVSGAPVAPVNTGASNLPLDFFNQSVNRALVDVQIEAVSSHSRALRFETEAGSHPAGAFNGAGTGSRAILGLGDWSGRPLAQAEPLTFDAKSYVGSLSLGVSLQVDLLCDGSDIRVVETDRSALLAQPINPSSVTPPVTLDNGYNRSTVSMSAPIWLSQTGAIMDRASTLLPDASVPGATPSSLDSLLARYPAACLKNASTGALALPRNIPTAAILWSLGDETTTTANVLFVRRLTVGSEVFENLQ